MEENASKALLMAAGMIIAVLLISLLVVLYGQISTYYDQEHKMTVMEQTQKFNAKFENYNRNSIRGSDLISLMNKVIDYNTSESYFDGTDYERIKVTIDLVNDDVLNMFKTGYEGRKNQYLIPIITNTTGDNWESDKDLIKITNTPSDMCIEAQKVGLNNITDTKLQQLASKISNIFIEENEDWGADDRVYRAYLLEDILGENIIEVDKYTGKTTNSESAKRLNVIKDITIQYYQYMQFKRAKFDCTEVKYDAETNRIVEMNFKLQTKIKNGKEEPVFD